MEKVKGQGAEARSGSLSVFSILYTLPPEVLAMILEPISRCPFPYLQTLPDESDNMSPLLCAVQKVEHLTPSAGRVGMK